MKIGILTFFWAENPGTFLQAYSTYRAAQKAFPDATVEMIDVRSRRTGFRPSKRALLHPGRFLRALGKYRAYRKALEQMRFSKASYVGLDPNAGRSLVAQQGYDLILVGSDTIYHLNPWHKANDLLPVYFLAGTTARKAMVAASCGGTSLNDFSADMRTAARDSLSDFARLGVRDRNTYDLFAALKGNEMGLELVPDPTYTYDIDLKKAEAALVRHGFDFEARTVLIHLPGTFTALRETVDWFRRRNWKIATFRFTGYADYGLMVDPEEWAGIPHYVDLVITDRFHGALFSLRNNTPVVGIDCDPSRLTSQRSSKIQRLLEEYGLDAYYVNFVDGAPVDDYLTLLEKAAEVEIDVADLNQARKERYMQFLRDLCPR